MVNELNEAQTGLPRERSRETDVYRTQICRYVEGDLILDISDMLSPEPRRNKVALTIVEFDGAFRVSRRVKHYVDVDDFKLVCHDIIEGTMTRFDDYKGSIHADSVEARVLTIKRPGKAQDPIVFQIDNGVGEPRLDGTVAMRQITESMVVRVPRWEARKLAMTALDYIRQWETFHCRRWQEARAVSLQPAAEVAPVAVAA
jgi:hypothetical protein